MYRVRWARTAKDELTALWLQADSATRQAITAATHQIDQALRTNPLNQGESRDEARRIMFVDPLALIFRVEPDGQTISVLHVGPSRRSI